MPIFFSAIAKAYKIEGFHCTIDFIHDILGLALRSDS